MKGIEVVCAVIHDGKRILATQRGYGEFKGGWEFPGGKIETGEAPEDALKREIREELDADIEIDGYLGDVECDYPSFHLSMKGYLCHLADTHIAFKEAEDHRYVSLDELDDIPFLPADRLLLGPIKEAFQSSARETPLKR